MDWGLYTKNDRGGWAFALMRQGTYRPGSFHNWLGALPQKPPGGRAVCVGGVLSPMKLRALHHFIQGTGERCTLFDAPRALQLLRKQAKPATTIGLSTILSTITLG